MADWEFTTANANTAQQWANKWWIGVKKESWFYDNGMIGPDENNDIIVEFNDLKQKPGYQLTYGQIRELTGAGVLGDADMEGQEEAPVTYDDQITLQQYRNAIRTKGKLSEQYKSDQETRKWAQLLLERWKAGTIDQLLFTAQGTSCTKYIYGGAASSTGTIAAGDYFTLALVAKATAYGDKATPQIVGKSKGGKRETVCVMSIDQRYDLKKYDASWKQAQLEAMQAGPENRIFTKSLGKHEDCALFAHIRAPIVSNWGSGANLNGATAFYMGVGAGAIAICQEKTWEEKTFDYGNKVGFCIGASLGVTKSVFNSVDNATVAVATYRSNN